MKCELCCDDNCLDLPSLTEIKGNYRDSIHEYMGYVILESMIWFDLIWFDLTRHSKSHWKQHSVWRRFISIHCRFASNKYFSISFPFSRFRCSCSRKIHSKMVEICVTQYNSSSFIKRMFCELCDLCMRSILRDPNHIHFVRYLNILYTIKTEIVML